MSTRLDEARAALDRAREMLPDGNKMVSLFDTPAEERDAAVAAVARTWSGEITERLDRIVVELARSRASFTTDDVVDAVPPDLAGVDLRVLGSIVRSCARRRIIAAGAYVPSRRRHSSPIRTWVSLIHDEGAR